MSPKEKREMKKSLEAQGLKGEELDRAMALYEERARKEKITPFLTSQRKPLDVGDMFNVINGFRENSNFGHEHVKRYPEEKEEIIEKYNKFMALPSH